MAFLPYEREVADPSPRAVDRQRLPVRRGAAAVVLRRRRPQPGPGDRAHPAALVPRRGRPRRGARLAGRDPVPGAAGAQRRRGRRARGYVDDHARLVDVGPTLAVLAGVPRHRWSTPTATRWTAARSRRTSTAARPPARGRHPLGRRHLRRPAAPRRDRRAARRGPADRAGPALRGGAVAEFPSITLTNHTSILTGVGPGRHGVMGNVYYDRATGEQVVPNDETTWHRSGEWLRPAVRTVFEMVHDVVEPGGRPRTASVNEAIDRGADYSTMPLIRATGDERRRRPRRRAAGPGRPRRSCPARRSWRTATSAGACGSTTSGSTRCCSCGRTRPPRPG